MALVIFDNSIPMNNLLPYLERVFLSTITISLILELTSTSFPYLLTTSLIGLAIVFFLCVFKPNENESAENEIQSFKELLSVSIIPKALWMGSALAVLGITFYHLEMKSGYNRTLGSGSTTIVIATIILIYLKASGIRFVEKAVPVLYRAIPTTGIAIHLYLSLM